MERTAAGVGGTFVLRPRSAGGFVIQASAAGFATSASPVLALTPEDTVRLELRIAERSVVLAPVTVVASSTQLMRDHQLAGFDWRRRRAVHGRFLGPDEIRRINPFYASDALQQVPFVRVQSNRFDRHVLLRAPLGRGFCYPTLYVDGHRVVTSQEFPLDEQLSGQRLAAVEVYERAASAPPEFQGLDVDCGVIVLWTRPAGRRG